MLVKGSYELTIRISCSFYMISNFTFFKISTTLDLLNKLRSGCDDEYRNMASSVGLKNGKYWGDVDEMIKLIYIRTILDPTMRLLSVKVALNGMCCKEMG